MSAAHAGLTLFALALFVDAAVLSLGDTLPAGWQGFKPHLSLAVAVALSFAYSADLPAVMGLPVVPYVGPVVTGLVLTRGSSFVSSLVGRWRNGSLG